MQTSAPRSKRCARVEGARPHYLIVVQRKKDLDELEVRLEVDESVFSDVMGDMVAFQSSVAGRLQSALGLRTRVTLVEPGSIERRPARARAYRTCGTRRGSACSGDAYCGRHCIRSQRSSTNSRYFSRSRSSVACARATSSPAGSAPFGV